MSSNHRLDVTQYARVLGYMGTKPVLVQDGRVTSHRYQNWHDFCMKLRSPNYSAKNSPLREAFKDFAVDHIEHFNAIPCEFEFEDKVYDAEWCWQVAIPLGLLALIKCEDA